MSVSVKMEVTTESHKAAHPQWLMSDEAVDQMVEQLPGLPVTDNFQAGKLVGRVLAAERDGDGVLAELDIDPDQLPAGTPIDGLSAGPGMIVKRHENAGRKVRVLDAILQQVGVWRKK